MEAPPVENKILRSNNLDDLKDVFKDQRKDFYSVVIKASSSGVLETLEE